jgi:hypothetical protein
MMITELQLEFLGSSHATTSFLAVPDGFDNTTNLVVFMLKLECQIEQNRLQLLGCLLASSCVYRTRTAVFSACCTLA